MSSDDTGGHKSQAHIDGQNRLIRIFNNRLTVAWKEQPVPCKNTIGEEKSYQTDVIVVDLVLQKHLACLEVDNDDPSIDMSQKKNKAKSLVHIKQRDMLITEQHFIPVVRFDISELKEGKKRTKYYMFDSEIMQRVWRAITINQGELEKKRKLN
jgi:hypothetical protein